MGLRLTISLQLRVKFHWLSRAVSEYGGHLDSGIIGDLVGERFEPRMVFRLGYALKRCKDSDTTPTAVGSEREPKSYLALAKNLKAPPMVVHP